MPARTGTASIEALALQKALHPYGYRADQSLQGTCSLPEHFSSIRTYKPTRFRIRFITVGPGISPNQPAGNPDRVADCTASRELHPALKNTQLM